MTEHEGRAALLTEARGWLGTRYHEGAAVKQHGVDCGQLLVAVFAGAGLIKPFQIPRYNPDFMIHDDREFIIELIEQVGGVECRRAIPLPGDVVLWRVGRVFGHGGIVTEWPRIIHASSRHSVVLEDDAEGNQWLARRPRRLFSLWP
jgi:cell wall-associated NlpC family hydrolase